MPSGNLLSTEVAIALVFVPITVDTVCHAPIFFFHEALLNGANGLFVFIAKGKFNFSV
jgi:hypothetical protein